MSTQEVPMTSIGLQSPNAPASMEHPLAVNKSAGQPANKPRPNRQEADCEVAIGECDINTTKLSNSIQGDREKDKYIDQIPATAGGSTAILASDARAQSPPDSSYTESNPILSHTPSASSKAPLSPDFTNRPPPLVHSPASSSIFERDVQEDIFPAQASPSIPSHLRTDNHIPPVLEASSVAITDSQLDPDSVEIVTHSMHQSATAGVSGVFTAEQSLPSPLLEGPGTHTGDFDGPYKAPDAADVRRLSFISFADVVNAEHAEASDLSSSRDSFPAPAIPGNIATLVLRNRSPSPLRSPSSHELGTSPPTSIANSVRGLETSPIRGGCGARTPLLTTQSPVSPTFGGEFNIETMRQALRRTGSGDLTGVRSQVSSTVGNDDDIYD